MVVVEIPRRLSSFSVRIPRSSQNLICLWMMLALIGLQLPLQSIAAQTSGGVPYVVDIRCATVEPAHLENLLREVSQTAQKKDDPPQSLALLKRCAEGDLPAMQKVLRSFGFFRGTVHLAIAPDESKSHATKGVEAKLVSDRQKDTDPEPPSKKPVTVRFEVDPGPRFIFSQLSIRLAEDEPVDTLSPPSPAEAGIADNAPYTASKVVEAGAFILTHYKENGYPFPKIAHRDVIADFATNAVQVDFRVVPGARAQFGVIRVDGLERLDPKYVYELIPWKEGEPFDIRLINKARRTLFDTNMFGIVELNNPGNVDNKGQLPITVQLKERAPHTIRLGLEYTTDYGPGIKGSWTHRNIFGMAEKLTVKAILNSKTRTAAIRFDKPMFLDMDNTFISQGVYEDETTDAYDSSSTDVSAILKRQFTKTFRAGGGLGFRFARVKHESDDQYNTYHLFYIPLTANLNTRKDLLNPVQGYHLSLRMAPYQDCSNEDIRFFRYLLSGSTYYNFNSGDWVVLAGRAAFGQIFGINHDEMPADLRFYAGGGGSIRGYAYQLAGPLQGDTPLGGLSVLEFSLELRFKITESIGLVPFLDGGTAFLDRVPDFGGQDILYGAGLGLRYYTGIGPIRLDVATPLRKREGVDSDYQIYVSIGQSF